MILDLLVYHDFTDTVNDRLPRIGESAEEFYGTGFGEGLYVAAVGPGIHEGRAATVVLAHGSHPMEDVQKLLDQRG